MACEAGVMSGSDERPARHPVALVAAVVGTAAAVVVGGGLILMAVTVGHCSFAGGRCPAERPPLLEDDVFGMSAIGAAIAVGVPMVLLRRGRSRWVIAVVAAAVAALLVGLIARDVAHG